MMTTMPRIIMVEFLFIGYDECDHVCSTVNGRKVPSFRLGTWLAKVIWMQKPGRGTVMLLVTRQTLAY